MSLFRLDSFRVLRENWDTYGGKPISEAALAAAESMQAVPVGRGGVQLEWHLGDHEIEIEFAPDGSLAGICVTQVASSEDQP